MQRLRTFAHGVIAATLFFFPFSMDGASASASPAIDASSAAAAFARAHQLCTRDDGKLWGVSLCRPIMIVDPATRQAVANEPVSGGVRDGSVYRFTVPKALPLAYTVATFQGKCWAMVLVPLPKDAAELAVTLMHESYHCVQPILHLAGSGGLGENGHLDTQVGRIWLRGEMRALRTALLAKGRARASALRDAVALALYRRSLFSHAARQERGVLLNEGLAESTGIDAALAPGKRIAYALKDLALVERSGSFVRAFPYGLGPAYGLLLDARDPHWRKRVTGATDLTLLAAAAYGASTRVPTTPAAQRILARYGGAAIVAQERARTKRLAVRQARYTTEFVRGAMLSLPMRKFTISFKPTDIEQFGSHGSVYHTLTLHDAWGTLHVDGGDALIAPAFNRVSVPRGTSPLSGKGWTLDLATGYAIVPAAANSVTVAKAASPASQSSPVPHFFKIDVAENGVGGYPQYRIPALTVTNKGTLIAAFDGRPSMADLPSHITDVIRRSTDDGRTWGPQQIVRTGPPPEGFGDPSLLVDRETGRIFLFYSATVKQGFFGSATGNDEHDPNVEQDDYSYSDDDGLTWHARRITAQIKDPSWAGMFAASGQGIQLTSGPHKGRLIQQYCVRVNGKNYAASVYSDDHGATWHAGQLVGPGMDENKTVQLADGDVMLNVRARPYRLVALSTDGGESYAPPHADEQLPDPGDNGSIVRYAPNAPAADPRAHWLLFSNTADTSQRRNLTVRLSCDDGKTWPVARTIEPGSSAYSTLAMLPDGDIGLLYERDDYRYITFASFDLAWLGGPCRAKT